MDTIPLDIVYHFAGLQYSFDEENGERWPVVCRKQDILSFRAVSRAFRDASWVAFRDVLAERVFSFTRADMTVLSEICRHERLAPLITTLCFGGLVYHRDGSRAIEQLLESRSAYTVVPSLITPSQTISAEPLSSDVSVTSTDWRHSGISPSSPTWYLPLASRWDDWHNNMQRAKDIYAEELTDQESFWTTGEALDVLDCCIAKLDQLQTIRVKALPRRPVTEMTMQKDKAYQIISKIRNNGWRDISRALYAISRLSGSTKPLLELCTSVDSHIRWPIKSCVFEQPLLFRNLRTLQISILEELLVAHETYTSEKHHGSALATCLQSAPHLKTLDLVVTSPREGRSNNSFILAEIGRSEMPYKLENLTLEYSCMSETTMTDFVKPHACTLKRLVLINPRLNQGTWESWMSTMASAGLMLDYLELWKPSEGAYAYYQNLDWFKLSSLAGIGRKGKTVPFLGSVNQDGLLIRSGVYEIWENTFPRYGQR